MEVMLFLHSALSSNQDLDIHISNPLTLAISYHNTKKLHCIVTLTDWRLWFLPNLASDFVHFFNAGNSYRYVFLLGFLLTLSKYCCCVYAGCIIVAAMCCIVTLHICVGWSAPRLGSLQSAPSVQPHQTPSPWTPTTPSTRTGSTPSARSQVRSSSS